MHWTINHVDCRLANIVVKASDLLRSLRLSSVTSNPGGVEDFWQFLTGNDSISIELEVISEA